MAANIKGIFLNNTININTYLVTWNFIDEKNKTKMLNITSNNVQLKKDRRLNIKPLGCYLIYAKILLQYQSAIL